MKTTKTPMRPAQRISFHKMYVDIAVNIGDTHNECITTVKLNVKFHIKTHVLNTISLSFKYLKLCQSGSPGKLNGNKIITEKYIEYFFFVIGLTSFDNRLTSFPGAVSPRARCDNRSD